MIENRNDVTEDKREPNDIGTGKKVGLDGCAFLI